MDDLEPKQTLAEPPLPGPFNDEEEWVAKHELSFPPYVLVLAVFALLAFVIGLTRLPRAINLGINFSQGKKAIAENHPDEAVKKLQSIVDVYPDAKKVRMELYRASVMAGDIKAAAAQSNYFEGMSVSREENRELNEIDDMAMAKWKELKK